MGANFTPAQLLEGHTSGVSCVKYAPSGRILASASADRSVLLWDGTSGSFLRRITGHSLGISGLCWSADSRFICTASDDTTAKLWDVETGKNVRTLEGHQEYVFTVDFSTQSNLVATGSFDSSVRLWDVRSGSCVRSLPAHSDPVTSANFNQDGTMFVTSSYDGLCRIWDTGSGQCLKTLIGDTNPVVSFAKFSPNGKFILAGSLDSTLRLWNYAQGKCAKTYRGHTNEKYCIISCFATGSQTNVVSGSEDKKIFVWDLQSKAVEQRLLGHSNIPISVDAHPTEELLASGELCIKGARKAAVRVWRQTKEDPEAEEDSPVYISAPPAKLPEEPSKATISKQVPKTPEPKAASENDTGCSKED